MKKRDHYIYALDIGSRQMTLAAGRLGKNGALSQVLIETQTSRGIFKGVVNDLAALADAIQQVFKKMEARCGSKALQTALSINGNYINTRNSVAAVALSERGTRSITRRDIERLTQQARTLGLELDENLLHEYPQGYSVDRHNMTLNPLGLHGRRFEMDLLLVSAHAGYIENITKAVEQAGLDAVSIVFSPVAAAEALLSEEDREKGAVLVDMGETLTGVLIFKDGVVRRARVLTFGSRNISELISNYFKMPLEAADRVIAEALEIGHEMPETEEVMVKVDEEFRPLKKKDISAVVEPEIDTFTRMLKDIVFESGLSGIGGFRVVATGGLSLLEGLLEKMEHDLGLPVRMGIATGLPDLSISKMPAYAGAIGALYLHKDAQNRIGLNLQAQSKNKLSRAVDYIANLYQDYF